MLATFFVLLNPNQFGIEYVNSVETKYKNKLVAAIVYGTWQIFILG